MSSSHPARRPGRARRFAARTGGGLIVLAAIVIAVAWWGFGRPIRFDVEPISPFYAAPSTLPTGSPGTILRQEEVESGLPHGVRGWRILYLSTAFDSGDPIAVSGVVFAPRSGGGDHTPDPLATTPSPSPVAGGDRGPPILAWGHPTTGVASRCAPSRADDGGASAIPGLARFVEAGFVVAASDYPGLGTAGPHPYLIGASEGRAVLDAVRAARTLTSAGDAVVAHGHSQGGHAVLFAGALAGDYAPELDLRGVAAAAPASELDGLVSMEMGTPVGDVLASMAITAWSRVYPAAEGDLLVARGARDVVAKIAESCLDDPVDRRADIPLAGLEQVRFLRADPLTTEPFATIIADNDVDPSALDVPVLLVQGTADDVVPLAVSRRFFRRLCHAGATVRLDLVHGAGHDASADDAVGPVMSWAADRLAGQDAPSTC